LKTSVASVAGLSALSYASAADAPSEKVVLAIIGIGSTVPGSVGGRGRQLLRPFSSFKDVEIAYLCDIDESFFPFGQKILSAGQRVGSLGQTWQNTPCPGVDRRFPTQYWQAGGCGDAAGSRLRSLARSCAGAAFQQQSFPLPLALAVGLRHRRARQQWHSCTR